MSTDNKRNNSLDACHEDTVQTNKVLKTIRDTLETVMGNPINEQSAESPKTPHFNLDSHADYINGNRVLTNQIQTLLERLIHGNVVTLNAGQELKISNP